MWIQIIKTHLKPGAEAKLATLVDQLQATEQPESGLVRSTVTRDQNNPEVVYTIVAFDSEERARAREADPRRQQGLATVRSTMAEVFDGAPEFLDLDVVAEYLGS